MVRPSPMFGRSCRGGYFESQVRDVFRHFHFDRSLHTKFVGIYTYATSELKSRCCTARRYQLAASGSSLVGRDSNIWRVVPI